MQLTSLSLALTRAGMLTAAWSPSVLFANNEPGVWYDPSDLTTLFQDAAGTTPVTAVEQPVGLMLDKSKGLVLGSEQVVNGNPFAAGSWTLSDPSVAVVGGKLVFTNAPSATDLAFQSGWGVVNRVYEVTIVISSMTTTLGGGVSFGFSDGTTFTTQGPYITSAGTYTYLLNAAVSRLTFRGRGALNANFSAVVESVSVKQVLGNHAFQTTSTKRPVLSRRVNLLTKTEQFDDGVWTKTAVTVTPNVEVAPDGTMTADLIYPSSSGTGRHVSRTFTGTTGISYRTRIGFKAAGIGFAYAYNVQGNSQLYVNLSTGATSNVGTNISNLTSTLRSDGWVIVEFDSTLTTGTTVNWYTGPCDASGSTQVTTSGTDGIYIWGASLVTADQASIPYQRVNTSTDYDADPTKFPAYLKGDSVSGRAMVTNTITPGTDKVQVFAGVRKTQASEFACIVESSTAPGSNNGIFYLFGPIGTLPDYGFGSKGTTGSEAAVNGYESPTTNVLTGLSDISGDSVILRINSTQAASSTADQGTGNFLAYPLYLFARNQSSLYFTGQLYSLVVRFGPNLPTATIEQVEDYVASKAGITI